MRAVLAVAITRSGALRCEPEQAIEPAVERWHEQHERDRVSGITDTLRAAQMGDRVARTGGSAKA